MLATLLLAAVLSLDSLMVGITYGLQKIKVPLQAKIIISLTSVIVFSMAMITGGFLGRLLGSSSKYIGASILVAMGLWFVKQYGAAERYKENARKEVISFRIPLLDLVVTILHEPLTADRDRSGYISPGEAVLLGLALAMDACGAGIGSSLGGAWPWYTPVVIGFFQFCIFGYGMSFGNYYRMQGFFTRFSFLPGLILIILGLSRLF